MQPDFTSPVHRTLPRFRPVAAACVLLVAGSAWADDPNPYYIGVSQAFSHDSNIFRTADAVEGDTYSTTGLLAGIDQPFGRQHFYASGNIDSNRFNRVTELNNTSYGLKTGLDWSTIERLSGSLYANLNQGLATYGSTNQLQLTKKNVQTTRFLQAQVRWGLASLLSLQASFSNQKLGYSAVEYAGYETTQDNASIGIFYSPSALLTLGGSLRHTRSKYTNVPLPDGGGDYGYGGNNLDLTVAWVPTGQSTINGRLSFGRLRYNDIAGHDSNGTTGTVSWNYRPTGKLTFDTSLSRDTGQDTTAQNLVLNGTPGTALGDNSRLTTSLSLRGVYAATAKIKLSAAGRYSHRSLVDTLSISDGQAVPPAEGSDNIRTVSLGATYLPSRNWQLACSVERDQRTVSEGTSTALSYPFSANTASCSVQFTLQ